MYTGSKTTILNNQTFFGKYKKITNNNINVNLLSNENLGIIFKRSDLKTKNTIKLNYQNAFVENNEIVLKNENLQVKNIEILLASIWANNIDNITIELDNEYFPDLNSTPESISFLLEIAKQKSFNIEREIFKVKNNTLFKIDDFEISLKPSPYFIISIQNKNEKFTFDNSVMPFKDNFCKIDKKKDKIKYDILSTLAIIYISNLHCHFELEIKNFSKIKVFEFFKNLFTTK